MAATIAAKQVEKLRERLEAIRLELLALDECMNTALLNDQWHNGGLDQKGFSMLDRLETLRILNQIGLAFTSTYYANPLGTVPTSVSDSVRRFFNQLDYLRKIANSDAAIGFES